ncbi:ABC transporter ATP-binding component [Bifidobacterium myosotis]|uniref:ABC transporter ATP-binding component n=1 Tax=Bifidobacterium myosotis TaxID=1630166 RepID=A0A261FNS2_9BIFI|nr:ABC transporter ATP-binding protein [Bifidobacterium myosotis]OZG60831.1 ABC transporter ATP-binding component [Bifidobacterium myosotis]
MPAGPTAQPQVQPQYAPAAQAWPPNPTAAVSIRGLFKRFDRKVAVNGLALDIPVGSFYGLVGPNGAGKTTTLNMVTGLLVPDAGTAMILGRNVWSDVNAVKRMIGVMPQPDQIFDRLTGMQLLVYSGMLRGMPRAEAASRAKDLLGAFDLAQAANTMVTDYSAGMTKKICLASAMIHSPRILVLDEPFESVDPVSSANLKDILIEYAKTGGTVIISSHVMALVERMCTHVAVVNNGQVCAAGTVEQVAAGEDLEDRFLQLVGGRHEAAHLAWLDGGARDSVGAPAGAPVGAPVGNAYAGIAPDGRGAAGATASAPAAAQPGPGAPSGAPSNESGAR